MKGTSSVEQFLIHRLTGYIEGQIAVFSATHNIPSVVLTQRVAELLSNPTGRSSEEDYVQPVRKDSSPATQGKRKVEVGGYSQNSSARSTAAGKKRGRPVGSTNKKPQGLRAHSLVPASKASKRKPYFVTPERRQAIADAQRNRWARAREIAATTGKTVTPFNMKEIIDSVKTPSSVVESQEVSLQNA